MLNEPRERAALVALLKRAHSGWPRVASECLERGSAIAVLDEARESQDALFPTPGDLDSLITEAAESLAAWARMDLDVHTVIDDSYPVQLREIHEIPPILFTRGRLANDTRAIAVVGSRLASERGLGMAKIIARGLVASDIAVVSGLAAGIDTAAHEAALAAGGRTVAVIGTGIRQYYPAKNRPLQDRIATEGLVVSQFWPDAPPRKQQFPMRNAVMSGYAAATVVVEAGERSGARNQARLALAHGRPVILLHRLLDHEWARDISERPGVRVVREPDELFAAVETILDRRMADLTSPEGVPELTIV